MNDIYRIDLSGHSDPDGFVEEVKKKYPDENVKISREGDSMKIIIGSILPLQMRINIASFLGKEAKRYLH